MSFLIEQAYAASGAVSGAGGQESVMSLMPMVLIFFGLMYFMVIRPQQKRAKEQKSLLSELNPGDEVTTAGGIVGKLAKVGDDFVVLSIADGFTMMVQKASVAGILPKGTMKKNNS